MTTDILSSPIDVLEKSITLAFENPNGSVLDDLRKSVAKGLIAKEIELDRRVAAPKGPSAGRGNAAQTPYIRLQLVYLEQLWSFIYGWLVIYEEAVQKRMLAGEFNGKIEFSDVALIRAEKLRRWGESLVERYTPWPTGLPTPSLRSGVEGYYAIKANGIFIKAVAFLLHHEYAHLRQGHLNFSNLFPRNDEAVRATRRALEREADDFAFSQLVSSLDGEDERRVNAWALLSPPLAALMLIRTPERLFPITHPIAHQRIGEVLSRLNFQSDENTFYFAYFAMIILRETLDRLTGLPSTQQTFDTAQEALDAVSADLDSLETAITKE